jgi:hypothetical protein
LRISCDGPSQDWPSIHVRPIKSSILATRCEEYAESSISLLPYTCLHIFRIQLKRHCRNIQELI